jgi:hypothetical protein
MQVRFIRISDKNPYNVKLIIRQIPHILKKIKRKNKYIALKK